MRPVVKSIWRFAEASQSCQWCRLWWNEVIVLLLYYYCINCIIVLLLYYCSIIIVLLLSWWLWLVHLLECHCSVSLLSGVSLLSLIVVMLFVYREQCLQLMVLCTFRLCAITRNIFTNILKTLKKLENFLSYVTWGPWAYVRLPSPTRGYRSSSTGFEHTVCSWRCSVCAVARNTCVAALLTLEAGNCSACYLCRSTIYQLVRLAQVQVQCWQHTQSTSRQSSE